MTHKNLTDDIDSIWDCDHDVLRKAGYEVIAPNNLPIRVITYDNRLLECEHGGHKDYKFPVYCELAVDLSIKYPDMEEWELQHYNNQQHALIYTDGCIAITLHECVYFMWQISTGELIHSSLWKKGELKLKQESIDKISEYLSKKGNI